MYAHVYEEPLGALALYGIAPERIESIRNLADGSQVRLSEAWNTTLYRDVAFAYYGEDPVFCYPLPDQTDTVFEIRLKEV